MAKRSPGEHEADLDEASREYARAVGQRLRTVRQQRQLTLEDVDIASGREFKDSALSAYERGDRIISVLRLQRLAAFYNVPVDHLLPTDATFEGVIDLTALEQGVPLSDWERATMELVGETARLRSVAESMLEELRRSHGEDAESSAHGARATGADRQIAL